MKNWNISRKLFGSFAAIVLSMCGVAAVVLTNLSVIQSRFDDASHTQDVRAGVDDVAKLMIDLSGQVRGYLLTGDEDFAKGVAADHEQVQQELEVLRGGVQAPDQKTRLEHIALASEAYMAEAGDPEIRLGRDPSTRSQALAIITAGANKRDMNAFKDAVGQFQAAEQQGLTKRRAILNRAMATARWALIAGVALAVGVASLMGWMLTRVISEALRRITATMTEVARGDFTKRVVYERRDEFGVLADGFNQIGRAHV